MSVWLEEGGKKVAATIQIGKPPDKAGEEARPGAETRSPTEPKKPEGSRPNRRRDPAPTAAVIDAEVDKHLAEVKVPASPQADDAEFLRRVTLDLTGRIPTYQQTVAFLDSKDPDKRRKLIDELLDSPEYGEHFATVWQQPARGPRRLHSAERARRHDPSGPGWRSSSTTTAAGTRSSRTC